MWFNEKNHGQKKYPKMLNALAVYNRRNGKNAFAYYVSTDLKMIGARIWEITRARWKIEWMFPDLKQNLSFGSLPRQGSIRLGRLHALHNLHVAAT
jgi:IS4 transposase